MKHPIDEGISGHREAFQAQADDVNWRGPRTRRVQPEDECEGSTEDDVGGRQHSEDACQTQFPPSIPVGTRYGAHGLRGRQGPPPEKHKVKMYGYQ